MNANLHEICVVGLGYVGLPLAVALARRYPVTGFDIDAGRIAELRSGRDRTREVAKDVLAASTLKLTDDPAAIARADLAIVTVPTPVDDDNQPDLGAVKAACATVGRALKRGATVVFESTVYPGVTEDICGPELERASGLVCGRDFFLGYSPERINPGDREHTVDRITKVVAGQTPAVVELLREVYGAVTRGGVFVARDIKTAEAAKVIENAQRDINIAFINEVTMIFQKLGLSTYDVLDAARTKWNFLGFAPGLVGGHCIGVDPFYLSYCAQRIGYDPTVILAGRRTNDGMGGFIAERVDALLAPKAKILVCGLTFKENVPDLRNTKVVHVIEGLRARGHAVDVHDPLADPAEAHEHYRLELVTTLAGGAPYDAIVGAVAHRDYAAMAATDLATLLVPRGLVADIKGMWRGLALPDGLRRWQL
ncbi:MAG: nucleotide sugar dehydrogenase [Alphaproteobacteria bacterium]|nr:nucleotide sugar dehydrogenase [Alphaproteobacteria bacterium]